MMTFPHKGEDGPYQWFPESAARKIHLEYFKRPDAQVTPHVRQVTMLRGGSQEEVLKIPPHNPQVQESLRT